MLDLCGMINAPGLFAPASSAQARDMRSFEDIYINGVCKNERCSSIVCLCLRLSFREAYLRPEGGFDF